MSMFSEFINRASSQGGKYLADRTGWDGGPPTLPTPNIPLPNDRNIFNVTLEKFNEGMAALTGPDSGISLLGRNLEGVYKGLLAGIENPEKAYNEAWGGGNWMNRLGMGSGDDVGSGGSGSSASSGSGDGGGDGDTNLTLNDAEEERARLDAIRRMLAGRYGRAETNLTGGAGYGSGSGRSIGGYSG